MHNRANAWRARRAQRGSVAMQEEVGLASGVSLARATLEQRLDELPEKVADLRVYLDDLVVQLRAAGDVEAAGAELDQARRDANAAQLEAASAQAAQQAADEAAERERHTAAAVRRELDQTRRAAEEERQRLQAQVDSAREATQQTAAELAGLRADLATARAEATAAQRTIEAEREALASLNQELERLRDDARAERERLRIDHTEQLTQMQRSADERVHTLTEALALARETTAAYRAQLPQTAPPSSSPRPPSKRSSRPAPEKK